MALIMMCSLNDRFCDCVTVHVHSISTQLWLSFLFLVISRSNTHMHSLTGPCGYSYSYIQYRIKLGCITNYRFSAFKVNDGVDNFGGAFIYVLITLDMIV